ncbi:hypothetical protein [Streptomyces thermodiastaticus]|jgi:hypothetical protein|nr:hypothetical protein [Streptomyces thermodiastaticus]MCE7552931.1 hypothetical protein [Streptomyces thermodiastaticus]GHF89271.1 hypothetical protein GCM10018787_42410 [Streptomyces thermodiastaticus]
MSMLMRAPSECVSWFWDLGDLRTAGTSIGAHDGCPQIDGRGPDLTGRL